MNNVIDWLLHTFSFFLSLVLISITALKLPFSKLLMMSRWILCCSVSSAWADLSIQPVSVYNSDRSGLVPVVLDDPEKTVWTGNVSSVQSISSETIQSLKKKKKAHWNLENLNMENMEAMMLAEVICCYFQWEIQVMWVLLILSLLLAEYLCLD